MPTDYHGNSKDALSSPPGGRGAGSTLWNRIAEALRDFPPAYFAMVMATGIVSIACHFLGYELLAFPLFYLNILLYCILWALTIARLILHRERFVKDLKTHNRGAGFFTIIASTGIMGNQAVILADARQPALILLGVGIIFWVVLIYTVFTLFTVQPEKPTLEIGINGTWLVATVATQSISVLSGILAQEAGQARNVWLFFSLCMFLTGCMLYLLIIALIFYRFMFFELTPQSLGHPYWINMGAVAITTLAGTTLIANSSGSPFLMSILPFTTGFTLFFWTTATWWIPLLVLLGIWRFVIHHGGFAYDPSYWSMVFPLGMYTTCTFQLARVNGLEFLMPIPRLFIFAAILAWALTFWGFVKSLRQFFRAVPTDEDL